MQVICEIRGPKQKPKAVEGDWKHLKDIKLMLRKTEENLYKSFKLV